MGGLTWKILRKILSVCSTPQVLDWDEPPRTDCQFTCDSPPRYIFYLSRRHPNGWLDLRMESKTARDNHARAQNQNRVEVAHQKEAKEAEAAWKQEPEDEDGGSSDTRLRAVVVVDFICNAGSNGDDGEHSPEDHFKYFFSHQKKMWAQLLRYCTNRGVNFTLDQAKGVWKRQYALYKRCKKADETTVGASGNNPDISEEAKAVFERTEIYNQIERV
ncbi:hypothetical protein JCM1841_001565 [Sporobolomyces salmonicolor]